VLFALLPREDRLRLERNLRLARIGGRAHRTLGEVGLHGPQYLVGGPWAPHGLVEAKVDRTSAVRVAAQVPLAPHPRRVPGIGQRLGDRHLPARQPVRATRDRHRLRPRANGMASGHEGRSARRALCLDVEVQKLLALGGEAVDPRCGRAAQHPATVATHFAPAQVVPVEEHYVRSFSHHPSSILPGSARCAEGVLN
jgi:hypothetical protein